MKKHSEKAASFYNDGHLCSQSVFVSFCEENGIAKELGFKISRFLGAGFLYRAEMCGAVSGALMMYSLKYSSGETIDELSDEIYYNLCKKHMEEFSKRHGSCVCKELLNHDLSTSEGLNEIREKELFNIKCPQYVKDSAEILSEAILKMEERLNKNK